MDTRPYGAWPSPISAASLVEGKVGVGELVVDGDDVWWSESRPDEGGRIAIVRWSQGDVEEMTPTDVNVRTSVHEYGGGAWWVDGGVMFFVDFADQRLRKRFPDGTISFLSQEPEEPRALRHADLRLTPDGRWLVCVREVHGGGRSHNEPDNEIVAIATDGSGEVRMIAAGADFYASPRPSRDGGRIAWVQWNHPNMPWDGTELWVADLDDDVAVANARIVAGGPDESVGQPEWAPNGELHFLSDRTGRSALYRIVEDGTAVVEVGGDFDIGSPAWVFGQSRYAIDDEGHLSVAMRRPTADALLTDRTGNVNSSWTAIRSLRSRPDGSVAYVAATTRTDAAAVIHGDDGPVLISTPQVHGISDGYLPQPEAITFSTTGDAEAHALFYPPANPVFTAPDGERPPLLVLAHGGPTGSAGRTLDLGLRYWTSRGWAVVDVDYRGSAGYGRDYIRALDGQWGIVDVDDCVAAARYLVERGDVDGDRLAIRGGSAGGFTVLAALTFHDVFTAGASRYGIGDLGALAGDTHKFEARYLDTLIGPYPEARDLYEARSPINHTHLLSAPMIVLQGSDDRVVPQNQAEMMVEALAENGIRHAYLLFEGEGHGFRQAANIVRALEGEYSFFAQVFGFEPADDIPQLEIRG